MIPRRRTLSAAGEARQTEATWSHRTLQFCLGLLGVFIAWELLAIILRVPVLPPPHRVIPVALRLAAGELGLHVLASGARAVSAIVIAVIAAAPLGIAMGLLPRLNRICTPVLNVVHPIPKIVFLPVIYVLVGVSNLSKVLLIALIVFFQVLVVVRDESVGLDRDLVLSARSIGAGRLALYVYIYLPGTLPATLTALRLSVGTAVAVLFIAEQSLTRFGLGYYIVVRTYQVLRYTEMYAGILAISLLGLLLYGIIDLLERRLTRYRRTPFVKGAGLRTRRSRTT
jgi:ABC-type nitrate/sulfonate/bicarbonate transport system permease component